MTLSDLNLAFSIWPFLVEAVKWLNWILYAIGLGIAVWAYLRCRKCGYLLFASYFALTLFVLLVMPPINRAIEAHRKPDLSEQDQKKMDDAIEQTVDQVIKGLGHPFVPIRKQTIRFPLAQILLVGGLWLLARREPQKSIGRITEPALPPPDDQKSG